MGMRANISKKEFTAANSNNQVKKRAVPKKRKFQLGKLFLSLHVACLLVIFSSRAMFFHHDLLYKIEYIKAILEGIKSQRAVKAGLRRKAFSITLYR